MLPKSVYYSLPANYPNRAKVLNYLTHNLGKIAGNHIKRKWWEQGMKYLNSLVTDSDVFVFSIESNRFQFYIEELPSGVKRELQRAINLNKTIYLLYRTLNSTYPNYYEISISETDFIQGLTGTSAVFYDSFTSIPSTVDKGSYEDYVEELEREGITIGTVKLPGLGTPKRKWDRRLLLF